MAKSEPKPNGFEQFVRKILAVPKQEIADAEEVDRRAKRGPRTMLMMPW